MADLARELNHNYGSTWVRGKDNNLFLMREFYYKGDDVLVFRIDYTNVSKPKEEHVVYQPTDYYLGFPDLCNINTDKYAIYVSRNPSRQYRKSVRVDNIRRDVIGSEIARIVGVATPTMNRLFDVKFVHQLFFPSYPDFKTAVDKVNSGDVISIAFNKNLSVGATNQIDVPCLYYRTLLIGTINPNDYSIELYRNSIHLKEQIQSILPTTMINIKE